ncbi:MAG: hypothetical protein ACI4XO_05570, partial [Akkermansia sp.]
FLVAAAAVSFWSVPQAPAEVSGGDVADVALRIGLRLLEYKLEEHRAKAEAMAAAVQSPQAPAAAPEERPSPAEVTDRDVANAALRIGVRLLEYKLEKHRAKAAAMAAAVQSTQVPAAAPEVPAAAPEAPAAAPEAPAATPQAPAATPQAPAAAPEERPSPAEVTDRDVANAALRIGVRLLEYKLEEHRAKAEAMAAAVQSMQAPAAAPEAPAAVPEERPSSSERVGE